ncbi:MAG: hypothetical protein K2I03_02350 [Lachnospiraceae bacterium]|nr:hypothetical protein [Lachnospiraceae bacterium]MDE6234005.1 hypothetical protein [Lachnospiraceae bacterium]MDE6252822.1 hypothetical protein [Lachnospiraceae bacterium]
MSEKVYVGVYQLNNGYWAYGYAIVINGKRKETKKLRNESGNSFKTAKQAAKAREIAIAQEKSTSLLSQQKERRRKTVTEVYQEYCDKGRSGKAYATIKKQDSLWNNHLKQRFGERYIDEITVAEIQDYLEVLYYTDNRAYSYTESFLKMFYLIFGCVISFENIKNQRTVNYTISIRRFNGNDNL